MWNTDRVGLRNLQYWNVYISKEELSKINYLNFSLRKLERKKNKRKRKKQITSKVSRRNEIKIREQISETENWKTDRENQQNQKLTLWQDQWYQLSP